MLEKQNLLDLYNKGQGPLDFSVHSNDESSRKEIPAGQSIRSVLERRRKTEFYNQKDKRFFLFWLQHIHKA